MNDEVAEERGQRKSRKAEEERLFGWEKFCVLIGMAVGLLGELLLPRQECWGTLAQENRYGFPLPYHFQGTGVGHDALSVVS